jgi:glutaminyl-peptide cyclotransferase
MNGKQAIWMMAAALSVAGCGRQTAETVPLSAPAAEAQEESVAAPLRTKISGAAALDEVRQFVELGPKGPSTPGAEKAAVYLLGRLQAAGVEAEIQEFKDMTPIGELTFRNVLGRIPGGDGKIVLIGAHYDTKVGIEGFVGANDSGSGTGLLIELARALKQTAPHPVEIRFALFDGEEARVDYSPIDGFHGSRHLAETMVADGSASNTAAMILLDMVGDRDLSVTMPRNSRPWLLTLAFESARQEGVRKYFQLSPYSFGDDHEAFMKQGVPAVDLIDFLYGSAPGKNDYWHKAQDTLDKVSAESLEIIGRVVLRMLDGIEQRDPAAEK